MKTIATLLAMFMLFMGLGGCSSIKERVEKLTDEELAEYVYKAAKFTAKTGLKKAIDTWPEHEAAIKEDALLAVKVINENIVPVFSGASTEEVLRSAVDVALAELSDKLNPATVDVVRLALAVVAGHIELPANPADKLDDRTRKAVLAFFKGLVDGVMEVYPPAPPAPVEPAPAPAPVPEPAPVPSDPMGKVAFKFSKPINKVAWPTNKVTLTWPTCACDPCDCNPCKCDCKCDPCKCDPCGCGL